MDEINIIELFQNYLIGDLSVSEKKAFEDRLKTDYSFKNEFAKFKLLEEGIEEVLKRKEAKLNLGGMVNRGEIINKDKLDKDKKPSINITLPLNPPQFRAIAIAASIIILAVFSFIMWPSNKSNKTIADFIETDKIPLLANNLSCDELTNLEEKTILEIKTLRDKPISKGINAEKNDTVKYYSEIENLINKKQQFIDKIKKARIKQCSSDSIIPFDIKEGIDTSMLEGY